MEDLDPQQQTNAAIRSADRLGVVVLPTLIGLVYGIYLLASEGMKTTNGGILTLLGLLTLLLTSVHQQTKFALLPAYLLGIYMFGVIGCMALGFAVVEKSGWSAVIIALTWMILGWRLLAGATQLRRT